MHLRSRATVVTCVLLANSVIGASYSWLRTHLGELGLVHAESDPSTTKLGISAVDYPLVTGGVHYVSGIGTHADSSIIIQLPNGAKTFSGRCGIDRAVGVQGSVVCSVARLDGQKLFESKVQRGNEPAAEFSVDVGGLSRVRLEVRQTEDGRSYDHTDWVALRAR